MAQHFQCRKYCICLLFLMSISMSINCSAAIYGDGDFSLLDPLPAEPSTQPTLNDIKSEQEALKPTPFRHLLKGAELERALILTKNNHIVLSNIQLVAYSKEQESSGVERLLCNVWHHGHRVLNPVCFKFINEKLVNEECRPTYKEIISWEIPAKPNVSLRRALIGHRAAVAYASIRERFLPSRIEKLDCKDVLSADLVIKDGFILWEISNPGGDEYYRKCLPYSLIDAMSGRLIKVESIGYNNSPYYESSGCGRMPELSIEISGLPLFKPKELTQKELQVSQKAMSPRLQHHISGEKLQRAQELLLANDQSINDIEITRLTELHLDPVFPKNGIELLHGRLWCKGYPTMKHVHYAFVDGRMESVSNPRLRAEVASWNISAKPLIPYGQAIAQYQYLTTELSSHSRLRFEMVNNVGSNIPDDLEAEFVVDQAGMAWSIHGIREYMYTSALIDATTGAILHVHIPLQYGSREVSGSNYKSNDTSEHLLPTGVPPEPSAKPLAGELELMKAALPREIIHAVSGEQLEVALSLFKNNEIPIDDKKINRVETDVLIEKQDGRKMWHIRGEIWRDGYPTGDDFVMNFTNGKLDYQAGVNVPVKTNAKKPEIRVSARQAILAYLLLVEDDSRYHFKFPIAERHEIWNKLGVTLFVNNDYAYWNVGNGSKIYIHPFTGRIMYYDNGIRF